MSNNSNVECYPFMQYKAPLTKQLGINVSNITDQQTQYANAARQGRQFNSVNQPWAFGTGPALDANGWPTDDFGILVSTNDAKAISGTYGIKFTGQANLTPSVTNGSFNLTYDPTTNTTTGTYTVSADNVSCSIYLCFNNTRRAATDTTNTGVTNIYVMRPTAPGAITYQDFGSYWDCNFLQAMSQFTIYRNMQVANINGLNGDDLNWNMRTLPSSFIQSFHMYGISIEDQIKLANDTNQNLWFCIPDTANDDYITKVALTIKYGSDGINPYTAVTANPVFPALKKKPYFEFSNEVWNYRLGPQAARNMQNAVNLNNSAQKSIINWDNKEDATNLLFAFRMYGLQVLRIRKLLGTVFGDATFNKDFFVLLANQLDVGPVLTEAINAITHNNSRPLNQLVSYVVGGWYANYNCTNPNETADHVFAMGVQGFDYAKHEQAYMQQFGIPGGGYEGGLVVGGDGDGIISNTPLAQTVNNDSRITKDYVTLMQNRFADNYCLLMIFDMETEPWAICRNNDVTRPRFAAAQLMAKALAANNSVVYKVWPLTIPVQSPKLPAIVDYNFETVSQQNVNGKFTYSPIGSGWTFSGTSGVAANSSSFTCNNFNAPEGTQVGFIQNVGSISQTINGLSAGTYTVSMCAAQRGSADYCRQTVQVFVNGLLVGTVSPSTTTYSVFTTLPFTIMSGNFTLTLQGINTNGDMTCFIDTVVLTKK